MANDNKILYKIVAIIVGAYFLLLCLVNAKAFLVPLVLAVVLSLLMVPVSKKLEKWGFSRFFSSLTNTLLLLLMSIGFIALISIQLAEFLADWDKVQAKLMPILEEVKHRIYKNTPLDAEDLERHNSMLAEDTGKRAQKFVTNIYTFLGDYILTFIYIFFLLNYRLKFRQFFIKLFPKDKHNEVSIVLTEIASITQGYLFGKSLMILFLIVLYSIGMGITGVNNFIVISIIAAMLTIIPYVGNFLGLILAIGLGYITNGDTTALIGIIATFTIGQFLESYILEPYVVGNKVNLDPFMVILAVVAGGFIWGVVGMMLAVPLLAISNQIFSHVKTLNPLCYLLSKNDGISDK